SSGDVQPAETVDLDTELELGGLCDRREQTRWIDATNAAAEDVDEVDVAETIDRHGGGPADRGRRRRSIRTDGAVVAGTRDRRQHTRRAQLADSPPSRV